MSMKSSPRSADDELDRLVGLGITRQQVEPGDDCLDPEVLASYADGGLSAAELAEADAHLARCRDCRLALALQVESDPFGASTTISIAAASAPADSGPDTAGTASSSIGARSRSGDVSGRSPGRSRIVHSVKTWLPLAAAVVVAAGLWLAFDRSRQPGPQSADAISTRNEPSVAGEAAARQAEPLRRPSDDHFETSAFPAGKAASGGPPLSAEVDRIESPREVAPQLKERREGFAAGARSEAESDQRARAAAPASPPPPPPPAALADAAAPSRAAGAAGREAQGTVTGQAAGQVGGQVAPAPAPAALQAPAQTAANQANQPNQANQNVAPQQAAPPPSQQQYVINQQTGPSANLNVASPPPAKTDERRQADGRKTEKNEQNEKSAGGPSNVKSADGAFMKAAEEPKSVARAKTAPESAAVPVSTESTTKSTTAGAGPAPRAAAAGSTGADRGTSDARVGGIVGGRADGDTSARESTRLSRLSRRPRRSRCCAPPMGRDGGGFARRARLKAASIAARPGPSNTATRRQSSRAAPRVRRAAAG